MRTVSTIATCTTIVQVFVGSAWGTPFKPENDDVIVERLPRSFVHIKDSQNARRLLQSNSTNSSVAIPLARSYLAIAQRTSDPAFVDYAEGVLKPFFDRETLTPELLYLRAVLRQHKHAFADALSDLDGVLAQESSHSAALLTKASILMTQGRYREAKQIFGGNLRLTRNLGGLTTFCTLTSLNGALDASYKLLLAQLSAERKASDAERAFVLTALGEMAVRLGELAVAEQDFKGALALEPDNSYLLSAYSDLLLSTGRNSEILRLIEENTPSEALLLRRIIACQHLHQPDARKQASRAAEIFRQSGHLRELAFLQLEVFEQAPEALRTALLNWEAQKEPIDAFVALKAAVACGNRATIQHLRDWLCENKVEDKRLNALVAPLSNAHSSFAAK